MVSRLGMWIFLGSEMMLFGGLFLAYTVGRLSDPPGFALGSHHLEVSLGTLNTALLLTSSWTVALAVERGRRWLLWPGLLLGLAFLAVKGYEWHEHWQYIHSGMFFWFYYVMTGLHAVHVLLGLLAFTLLLLGYLAEELPVVALYWHLVDIIWIFLFPCLYLVGS